MTIAVVKLLGGVRATIFAALLALSLAGGGYYYWQHGKLENKIEQMEQRSAAKEKSYYKSIYDTVYKYHVNESNTQDYVDSLVHQLRTNERRLRTRFSCPTGPTGGSDGGEGRGLLTEDGEFLIREAARADSIVRQLRLCQQTIEQYQELNKD